MGSTNIKLIASTCTVNLLAFATGSAYSWASTVLTDLKSDDAQRNPLGRPVTPLEESWIASLISLGAVCGSTMTGILSQKFGRKNTLLSFSVPMFVSHLIMAFATTPVEFFIARFMIGLGVGCVFTVIPMYVGEISETNIRGLLGCIMGIFISIGLLFVYAVGPWVNLRILSFILLVPIGLFIAFFWLFIPESPYYYVAIGDDLAAEISLNKLRNNNYNQKELAVIKETVDESSDGDISFMELWQSKSFTKGITITACLMVFQQAIGITVVLSYMEKIFTSSGASIASTTSTIIVATIQLITVIISSFLVDKWGRKLLLAMSSAGLILPLFSLGYFFLKKSSGDDVSVLWWLPISSLVMYIITYNFGLATLPWALVGELFSSRTKSIASSITAITCLFLAFFITLIFPTLEGLLGLHGVFFSFGGSAILCLLFVLWYVPETKEKTFKEILEILEE